MDNRYIFHSNNSAASEPAFLILKGVALGCLCLWTVVANVLVFVVLYKNPRLQTVPNLLVGNLAFSDLCLGCVVLPLSAVYAVTLHWPFGKLACEIWISTDVLSCTASIWNLSMIGLDRYWAITSPITYITKRNMQSAVLMILSIWGLSSLISLAPFLGWRQYSEKGNYFFDNETQTSHCQFLELPAYTLYSATGSFYIPLLVMFFVYFQIYRAFADHRARQIYRQKVIKKHIESTILHEISRVLPTSDEFAKEGDDDEEEEEDDEEEEDSENDNIIEDDEEEEESDRPHNNRKISQVDEESGEGAPTTSGGSTSGSANGVPETTNTAATAAAAKLRQLTPAPSILKPVSQVKYNTVRCDYNENHANTNNNISTKLIRTNELTMNEKSPLKKTSSAVGPDAVNQRRKTTAVCRKKSAPAKTMQLQDATSPNRTATKIAKALQFSSHTPSARFPSVTAKSNSQLQQHHGHSRHGSRRQVAHPTKGVYRDRSLTYERVQRHKMRKEKRAMLRASLQKKPPAISAAKERRGVKVLGIILGCFTVCWLPFFIMYIVTGFCRHCRPNAHIEQFITWLGYSNSAMNPIIYTVFNRRPSELSSSGEGAMRKNRR